MTAPRHVASISDIGAHLMSCGGSEGRLLMAALTLEEALPPPLIPPPLNAN